MEVDVVGDDEDDAVTEQTVTLTTDGSQDLKILKFKILNLDVLCVCCMYCVQYNIVYMQYQ